MMIGTAVTALLAAMGIVLLILCVSASILMPATGTGWIVLFADESGDCLRQLCGWRFLQKTGLCRLPLIVVDCGMTAGQRLELIRAGESPGFCCLTQQEWNEFREREERVSGT